MPIHTKNKGFSIIEVLLAGFVLSVGLTAIVGLFTNTLRTSISSRNEIIAALLSQEGIELTKNAWDNGTGNIPSGNQTNCITNPKYGIGPLTLNCSPASNDLFLRNVIGSYDHYTHLAGSATRFKRKIQVVEEPDFPNTGDNSKRIISYVTWSSAVDITTVDTSSCTAQNSCVFSRTMLTSWR